MSQITRRTILGGLAASAAPLPALAAPAPVLSPEERLEAAIEELKAAADAALTGIEKWQIVRGSAKNCPLVVVAYGNET